MPGAPSRSCGHLRPSAWARADDPQPRRLVDRHALSNAQLLALQEQPPRRLEMPTTLRSYATNFDATEDPISEGGAWTSNPDSNRTRVVTASGFARGTQGNGDGYDDSYAQLNGAWSPDTEIILTVYKTGGATGFLEIEPLFRIQHTGPGGSARCYEPHLNCTGDYINFVKWLGPITDIDEFEFLVPHATYSVASVSNGDLLRVRCTGQNTVTINAWYSTNGGANWTLITTSPVVDTGASSPVLNYGQPGIGFYRNSDSGAATTFGISRFEVTEL